MVENKSQKHSPVLVPSSTKGKVDNRLRTKGLVDSFCKGFLQLVYLSGIRCSHRTREIFLMTVHARFQSVPPSVAVDVFKVLLAHPLAVVLGNVPPSVGLEVEKLVGGAGCGHRPWRFLCPGKLGSLIHQLFRLSRASLREPGRLNRTRRDQLKGLRFAASFLQLKRSLPDLDRTFHKVALDKHGDQLSKEVTTPDAVVRDCLDVVDWIFSRGGKIDPILVDWRDVSLDANGSACMEAPRGEGGAQRVQSDMSCSLGSRLDVVHRVDGSGVQVPRTLDGGHHSDTIDHFSEDGGLRERHCRAVCVSDPLKARVVTAVPAFDNYFRPLQKAIHSRLRKKSYFRLIGEWVGPEHLEVLNPMEGEFISSGDYSCATDGISSRLGHAVLGRILDHCRPSDPSLFPTHFLVVREARRSLTDNVLHYPGGRVVEQRSGQLMGCHLSFPVLCIINLAIWLRSRFEDPGRLSKLLRGVKGRSLPVRINGDDIISVENRESYTRWERAVTEANWALSVGKCYQHPSVGVINSQVFILCSQGWKHLPCVNLRLLRFSDKHGRLDEMSFEEIGARATEFVRGAPRPELARRLIVSTFQPLLRLTPRPLFFPIRFGGLGGHLPSAKLFASWWLRVPEDRKKIGRVISEGEPPPFSGSRIEVRGCESFVRRAVSMTYGMREFRRWGEVDEPPTEVEIFMAGLRDAYGRCNQRMGLTVKTPPSHPTAAAYARSRPDLRLQSAQCRVDPRVDQSTYFELRRRFAHRKALRWQQVYLSPKKRLVWDHVPGPGFWIESGSVIESTPGRVLLVPPERAGLGWGR